MKRHGSLARSSKCPRHSAEPNTEGRDWHHGPRCEVEMAGIEPASEEFGTRPTTSLVGFRFSLGLDATDRVCRRASRSLKEGLSHPHRHQDGRTLADVSPKPAPPKREQAGRGHSWWPKRQLMLGCRLGGHGVSVRRCSCCIGTCGLPLFHEVEAPQLAVSSQPSPSKPFIPPARV